jgi:hypothetical protein
MARILWWYREITKTLCMYKKELPMCFMDLKAHIIIHIPIEVELVGVLSCRWMLFLERYMKRLKWFVRKMEK